MKCFSLFSGIGGFDLAMRNLGHVTVGACEIDQYARSVYAKNFPGVPIWEDATKIKPKELPDFDILCAGFPCQAFSIAGKRRGFDDTRGSLFFEIARIVKEKQPSYLLLENVKGLLSHDKGQTFHTIIRTLDEVGYDCQWQIINSKYFVCQNRERIFIICNLRGQRTRKIFPLGENDTKVGGEKNLKQIGNVDTVGNNSLWGRVYDSDGIATNLNANGGGLGAKTGLYAIKKVGMLTDNPNNAVLSPDGISSTVLSGGGSGSRTNIAVVNDHGTLKEREISNNLDANYWKGMDNHAQRTMIIADRSRSYAGKGRNLESPKDICNSLTSVTKDNLVLNNMRIRRLTPKECERLQGFPDDWTKYDINGDIISDTQRYRMCGNAVTVPVIQYIGENFENS